MSHHVVMGTHVEWGGVEQDGSAVYLFKLICTARTRGKIYLVQVLLIPS